MLMNLQYIRLDEVLNTDDSDLVNCFRVQIAKDWLFENIIASPSFVQRDTVTLNIKSSGQVYIRARVESDEKTMGNGQTLS